MEKKFGKSFPSKPSPVHPTLHTLLSLVATNRVGLVSRPLFCWPQSFKQSWPRRTVLSIRGTERNFSSWVNQWGTRAKFNLLYSGPRNVDCQSEKRGPVDKDRRALVFCLQSPIGRKLDFNFARAPPFSFSCHMTLWGCACDGRNLVRIQCRQILFHFDHTCRSLIAWFCQNYRRKKFILFSYLIIFRGKVFTNDF